MLKKLLLIALLLIPNSIFAQNLASGSITTNGDTIRANILSNVLGGTVSVSGTWTGTITPQCLIGNNDAALTSNTVYITDTASPFTATNAVTANGFFTFVNVGCRSWAMTATAAMTGTANIVITQGNTTATSGSGTSGTVSLDVDFGAGAVGSDTQRIVTATDDLGLVATQTLAGAVSSGRVLISLPQGPGTCTTAQVGDSASSITLIAANTSAVARTFFNDSTAILYLDLDGGTASTTDYTVQIPAGGFFVDPTGYTGLVTGIWASDAAGNLYVTECQ